MKKNQSFQDVFDETIAPRIRRLDILLKTGQFPISVGAAATALDISKTEAFDILNSIGAEVVDKPSFFALMRRGSSQLCRLLNRELEVGSPSLYNPSQIAYIYELDAAKVYSACQNLPNGLLSNRDLPAIFAKITM